MKRFLPLRPGLGWAPILFGLVLVLVLGLGALGCGGDDETDDTADEAATETTDEATDDTAEGTEGSDEATDDTMAEGDAPEGEGSMGELMDELPDDFPDFDLPDGSSLLGAQEGDFPDPEGEMFHLTAAAFESSTDPAGQYEFFRESLPEQGWEILADNRVEEPGYFYSIMAQQGDEVVAIAGGDDSSGFDSDFPDAENPFAVTVGPPAAIGQ